MIDWLTNRPAILIYGFLLFNAFFESFFPPYPSDALVLVFSFIAGQGACSVYIVYFCTVIGSITGIMVIYYLGKTRGDALINFLARSFLGRFIPVRLIERAKVKFHHRSGMVVFLNRFIPGMRAPICFAAGLVGVEGNTFFLFSSISVSLWNFFLVLAGFYVGTNWETAQSFLKTYNLIIASLIIFIVLIVTVSYFIRRKRRPL